MTFAVRILLTVVFGIVFFGAFFILNWYLYKKRYYHVGRYILHCGNLYHLGNLTFYIPYGTDLGVKGE